MKHEDILSDHPKDKWQSMSYISISKLVGKQVVDLEGWLGNPYGQDAPLVLISRVRFADGTYESLEGSHDTVWLEKPKWKEEGPEWYTDETLNRLHREDPEYEDDEDE